MRRLAKCKDSDSKDEASISFRNTLWLFHYKDQLFLVSLAIKIKEKGCAEEIETKEMGKNKEVQ